MRLPHRLRTWLVAVGTGGVLAVHSAGASVAVVGSLDRHFHALPGEVIVGEIDIHNSLDEPAWVRVEISDYSVDVAGLADYPKAASHERSLAPYIQLMSPEQTLQPKSSGRIGFQVKLPTLTERPELMGAYWAVVMIEPQSLDTESIEPNLDGWLIKQRFQTAVRITTEIQADADPALDFRQAQLLLQPAPIFQVELTNPSERLLDLDLIGELFTREGRSLGRIPLGRWQIYPGHARRLQWALDVTRSGSGQAAGSGDYQALIIAHPRPLMRSSRRFGGRFDLHWGD